MFLRLKKRGCLFEGAVGVEDFGAGGGVGLAAGDFDGGDAVGVDADDFVVTGHKIGAGQVIVGHIQGGLIVRVVHTAGDGCPVLEIAGLDGVSNHSGNGVGFGPFAAVHAGLH